MAAKRRNSAGRKPTTAMAGSRITAAAAAAFRRRLAAWFRRAGRDLPWRRSRDPYEILVSEAMLQQTQVSRVLDFYSRFLGKFPTLESLAAARPKQVREQWEGLGYYARARNLHSLAKHVARDGGAPAVLPSHPKELQKLPGIGPYTAGAVASFAFERRAALVDTNVARVIGRFFAPRLNPRRPSDLKKIWAIAEAILPRSGKAGWAHNQALMELGALVCTARVKRCGECPVCAQCPSRENSNNRE